MMQFDGGTRILRVIHGGLRATLSNCTTAVSRNAGRVLPIAPDERIEECNQKCASFFTQSPAAVFVKK